MRPETPCPIRPRARLAASGCGLKLLGDNPRVSVPLPVPQIAHLVAFDDVGSGTLRAGPLIKMFCYSTPTYPSIADTHAQDYPPPATADGLQPAEILVHIQTSIRYGGRRRP